MRWTFWLLPHIHGGIWLTVSRSNLGIILGDKIHMDGLSYCSLTPQFKDLHLHSTVVHFLDLAIYCTTSDILNS